MLETDDIDLAIYAVIHINHCDLLRWRISLHKNPLFGVALSPSPTPGFTRTTDSGSGISQTSLAQFYAVARV